MKRIIIVLACVGIAGLGFVSKNKIQVNKNAARNMGGAYDPIAVLELFTSEGCSSCPPADNLLPELAKADSNIIALSFHVDYWNRLGWTDPFSSSQYSERQSLYGKQFQLESIYTPQLVVNGEYELVGSNRGRAESAIKNALKEKALVKLGISDVKLNGNKLTFSVNAEGQFSKTDLIATIVQKKAEINVRAGENHGAKLTHTNVVRYFEKKDAESKQTFEIKMPAELKDWELVVFAQQKAGLKITGAASYVPY